MKSLAVSLSLRTFESGLVVADHQSFVLVLRHLVDEFTLALSDLEFAVEEFLILHLVCFLVPVF